MKQKYQALGLLQKYFDGPQSDFENLATKRIGSKKNLYSPGDAITHIYLVLSGDVSIQFSEKDIIVPSETIVGDYEIVNQLSRRTSSLKAKSKSIVAILPKQFYSRIRKENLQNYQFLKTRLETENPKLRYALSKNFKHRQVFRGDQQLNEHGPGNFDVSLIKCGVFTVRKFIGVGVIEKYKIEVQKQFSLVQLGEGQLINQNITCDSPKGEIFLCQHFYLQILLKSFPELQTLFQGIYDKKNSILDREKSIKKICIQNSYLSSSILPTVFQNEKLKHKQKIPKPKEILKTEPTEKTIRKIYEQNHYQINRSKNNGFFSTPTNSNLSLIPLARIRKPSLPQTVRVPRAKVLQKFFKCKTEKVEAIRFKSENKEQSDYEIPENFTSRFQKKMFLKPSNPFRHFRQKSASPEESLEKDIQDSRQDNKSTSSPKRRRKSLLQISGDQSK